VSSQGEIGQSRGRVSELLVRERAHIRGRNQNAIRDVGFGGSAHVIIKTTKLNS
jgi:hypothetical protein